MTDYEQAVVKYLSLIAQELVRITEAIQDTDTKRGESAFKDTPETLGAFSIVDLANGFLNKQQLIQPETRPTFAADALEVPSEPKITLEK